MSQLSLGCYDLLCKTRLTCDSSLRGAMLCYARQGKARQGKARQGTVTCDRSLGGAMLCYARQGKARQGKAGHRNM